MGQTCPPIWKRRTQKTSRSTSGMGSKFWARSGSDAARRFIQCCAPPENSCPDALGALAGFQLGGALRRLRRMPEQHLDGDVERVGYRSQIIKGERAAGFGLFDVFRRDPG